MLDTIAHLTYFDGTAVLAATDAGGFRAATAAALADLDGFEAETLQRGRSLGPTGLLEVWRTGRHELIEAFAPLDPSSRLPWYGPDMSARSFATARLMETWAHGQDIADAVGAARRPTDRLRHVAHIGVRARPFSYVTRGLPVPEADVHVELVGPSGATWAWGDVGAEDRLSGAALDFCLVVTQRRHPADTTLVAEGGLAEEWLTIAQAFAGPPGPGRQPGQFKGGRST